VNSYRHAELTFEQKLLRAAKRLGLRADLAQSALAALKKKSAKMSGPPSKLWSMLRFWCPSIVAFAIFSVIPLAYLVRHSDDKGYIDGLMGNWLSTLIGVFIGALIVALQLARWLKEHEQAQKEAHVLSLVRNEFEKCRDTMNANCATLPTTVHISYFALSTAFWDALSNSGKLDAITDIELLNVISAAYDEVRAVKVVEEVLYRTVNYQGMVGQPKGEQITSDLLRRYPLARVAVEEALQKIGARLQAR
jgi:hypothetical protein